MDTPERKELEVKSEALYSADFRILSGKKIAKKSSKKGEKYLALPAEMVYNSTVVCLGMKW